jgi:hypothetical protein
MYHSVEFEGYESTNVSEDNVPIGSLDYLSTKYEVNYFNI